MGPRDLLEAGALPVLPLRSSVLFPGTALPIDLGRTASTAAVRAALALPKDDPAHGVLLLATQRDPMVDRPLREHVHDIAVLGRVRQTLRGLPGRMTVFVQGLRRVELGLFEPHNEHLTCHATLAAESASDPNMARALAGALVDLVDKYEEHASGDDPPPKREHALKAIHGERDPGLLADKVAAHLDLEAASQVELLQTLDTGERLRVILELATRKIQSFEVKRDIDKSVRDHLSRHEHEAVLRHKMRAIQSELQQEDASGNWLAELTRRIRDLDLPDVVSEATQRQLRRLDRMNPESAEAVTTRTWVECIADLPWTKATDDVLDLIKARATLEEGHHGLEKVKKRILEYLCVRKLAPDQRAPIICLAGPPGVGKTSLAQSIASALGRKLVRFSLGGVRDDSEIRGHRRTYIGAQPGRLIQAMRTAGAVNPIIVLDEIDKLSGADMRGDPASALLEALDPEQNDEFEDHYLGVPYDLSKVIFICTANELGAIPAVLRDRLEIIEISGYTVEEKLTIARKHLLPRERAENGLRELDIDINDAALERLAVEYTRESGVRNLQRNIAAIMRDIAMHRAEGTSVGSAHAVDEADVLRVLGPPRFHPELAGREPRPGVATGLGWTPTGGRILFVEATLSRGKGKVRMTGRLGDVMRESATTALSLVRSRALDLGLPPDFMSHRDVHVHLPSGAIPKDGPSAGVALTCAIVSALSDRPIRHDIAMTGEVTLVGHVLPVGGIREKVLAAHRAGIRDVVLPERNRKDEPEIPEAARADLRLHWVSEIEDVLALVMLPKANAA